MGLDYGSGTSEWVKLPKQGESYDYSQHGAIVKAEKIEGRKGFNFQKSVVINQDGKSVKGTEDLGYRYEFVFEDGKRLSLSQWKPFYAFKDADVQEGDYIIISHPAKGEWKVEKINQGLKTEGGEAL